jgi:hypothetical protein
MSEETKAMKQLKGIPVVVLLLVCFLCFGYPNAAKAGTVTNSTDLTAGMASWYLNTFTGITDGISLSSPMSFSGITVGTGSFSYNVASAPGDDGLYGIGTTGSASSLSTLDPDTVLTITFTSGNVTAVGGNFFTTDVNGNPVPDLVTVLLSGGSPVTLSASGNDFWGFLSTPSVFITGLTITPPVGNENDFAAFANFYAGAVPNGTSGTAPEPATFVLLGAGLIAGGLLRKRLSRV